MYICSSFSSDSSKYFSHWHATSVSMFPPSFLCSSTVSCPPEKAWRLILFLICLGESVMRIVFSGLDDEDLSFVPVSGHIILLCRIAGFLCPSFSTTSLEIRKCGSWSTPSGIRHNSFLLFRIFGRKAGTVCIDV